MAVLITPEVDGVEKMKDLGDWEYDPTAVYDSDDETEDEEENCAAAAAAADNDADDNDNTQTTDAETATTQNNEAENADGATTVKFYVHPTGRRVRVRNRQLDEYVWGRNSCNI